MSHEEEPKSGGITREQYDGDKNKRLLPQNIIEEQPYIFRAKAKFDTEVRIADLAVTAKRIVRSKQFVQVEVIQEDPENTELTLYLNAEGIACTREAWPININDMTFDEERGYFMNYPTLSEIDLDRIFASQGKIRNVGQLALMPPYPE